MGNTDRVIKVDSVIMFLMIVGMLACLSFISFEFGKKKQCELDKNYVFSYDYSRCLKVGSGNLK